MSGRPPGPSSAMVSEEALAEPALEEQHVEMGRESEERHQEGVSVVSPEGGGSLAESDTTWCVQCSSAQLGEAGGREEGELPADGSRKEEASKS